MNGFIMLKSTRDILMWRRNHFETIIKKNKYSDRPENIKKEKIKQALSGAKKIAPYLRNFSLIENYNIPNGTVTFGCDVFLKKGKETKTITILGEADVEFNPKYRTKERFIGYGSNNSLLYVGKRSGDSVEGWKIVEIKRFIY